MSDNAADVADDYRQALEDLTMNSRIEIATLTNIARENAGHGHEITEVLQNHIKKVPPARTLPALYVLDSVVKNVPTPYALYFGPKLYSVFMGAYTKVDNATRRKMEEMLKTWKEPVPGSISTKPVFPPEHVRPIENALIAARNVAYAAQQNSFHGQQQLLRGPGGRPSAPARDTPTPPTARPISYQVGPPQGQPPFPGPNGQPPPHLAEPVQQQPYPMRPLSTPNMIPARGTPQQLTPSVGPLHPPPQPAMREAYGTPQPRPGISVEKLKDDIQQLIIAEKAEFARDPHDTSKQSRLKALLDLQTIIQSQDMPQDQLMLVKKRIAELAVNMRASSAAPLPAYTHTPTPPAVSQQPTPVPPVAAVARPPPFAPAAAAPPGGLSLDALFGQGAKGALATLLSGAVQKPASPQAPVQQRFPPPPPPATAPLPSVAVPAAVRSTPPQKPAEPTKPAAAPALDPAALLAMLRQSGILSAAGTPPAAACSSIPPPTTAPGVFPSTNAPPVVQPYQPPGHGNRIWAGSLKQFRPLLAFQTHDGLGTPCTQCGRRFQSNEDGRRKKTAHMDWHFRVHQRIAEAEKRGQHRSWYVDEMDWIKSREAIDVDYVAPEDNQSGGDYDYDYNGQTKSGAHASSGPGGGGSSLRGKSAQNKKQPQYIPVPEDQRINTTCPICQERFEMTWLDEAQEWVWMDTVKVPQPGNLPPRVYHASCHKEAARDGGGGGGGGTGTTSSSSYPHHQQNQNWNAKGTPEPVLGKRKAEVSLFPGGGSVSVKRERF
ncbi:hypothetical protein B0H63DRAFT_143099 [Podospora didyma]|uniref:CID domain-containing protein n=1 Tax=Podospora didyma TaxID=330526 RepID=A0AAE0U1B0_9PEZI|nr:hypothetical protein B0H63DRAFT_143099 [Podospora didyma]